MQRFLNSAETHKYKANAHLRSHFILQLSLDAMHLCTHTHTPYGAVTELASWLTICLEKCIQTAESCESQISVVLPQEGGQ